MEENQQIADQLQNVLDNGVLLKMHILENNIESIFDLAGDFYSDLKNLHDKIVKLKK